MQKDHQKPEDHRRWLAVTKISWITHLHNYLIVVRCFPTNTVLFSYHRALYNVRTGGGGGVSLCCLLLMITRNFSSNSEYLVAGHRECLQMLLDAGASIDVLDAKAQTPLFVSLVNQHWECARLLLEAGADPNGSPANLCSPLSIMCQRGFYPGVKLLTQFGADTEDIMRILSGMPGLPITSCATYHHLKCFALLLLHGAAPDLSSYKVLDIPAYVYSQCSVVHAIIKYR